MTFDEFCAQFRLRPTEREALVWHLAAFRHRKTVEALSAAPTPPNRTNDGEDG